MKKALIISYSQAGQTQRALQSFAQGLSQTYEIEYFVINPLESFAFPWTMRNFFRAFPRCVKGLAPKIHESKIDWDRFDLIIFGYQVWFLSPSLPAQGFLQSEMAKGLKGKEVLCVATCRNLWRSAFSTVKSQLKSLGAQCLGQVTLCELSPTWATFVTTPRWMLTGKKSAFWFFPEAGIQEQEFEKLKETALKIGHAKLQSQNISPEFLTSNLNRLSLEIMDAIGQRFFNFWAGFILWIAPSQGLWQDFCLVLFRINLIILIVLLGPCTKAIEAMSSRSSARG